MTSSIQHLNPEGMHKNPAFSQLVVTQGNGKTIYIGGQNAVNAQGEIVGKGDLAAQTEQVMKNIILALQACGGTIENVVKLTIYMVQGQNPYEGFQASQKYMSKTSAPPAITGLFVAGLAIPDYLVEIDAIAFIPDKE